MLDKEKHIQAEINSPFFNSELLEREVVKESYAEAETMESPFFFAEEMSSHTLDYNEKLTALESPPIC